MQRGISNAIKLHFSDDWDESSSAMETDTIREGFQQSEQVFSVVRMSFGQSQGVKNSRGSCRSDLWLKEWRTLALASRHIDSFLCANLPGHLQTLYVTPAVCRISWLLVCSLVLHTCSDFSVFSLVKREPMLVSVGFSVVLVTHVCSKVVPNDDSNFALSIFLLLTISY